MADPRMSQETPTKADYSHQNSLGQDGGITAHPARNRRTPENGHATSRSTRNLVIHNRWFLAFLSPVTVLLALLQDSPNSHVGRWVALFFILLAIDARSPFHCGPSYARLESLHVPYSVPVIVSIVYKPRILSG